MSRITASEVQSMVSHWLGCPPNGYFGSLYGSDIRAMLQAPQRSGIAESFIRKLRNDVPVLSAISAADVQIGFTDEGPDRRNIVIGIGSQFAIEAQPRATAPPQSIVTSLGRSRRSGFISFASGAFSFNEDDGQAQVSVMRTGGSRGIATVDYATSGGTAVVGRDYISVTGTLTWLDGDSTPKLIAVPLVDDDLLLTGQTLTLTLFNPVGAFLGVQPTTTLTLSIDAGQFAELLRLRGQIDQALYVEYPRVES
ncbi:Calx-beta domain-containing protein [Nevskia sp.]|uniref:Calx-beta domain-containing protein n=1 Tax=Nevskia sp. TaxID=1929292 RepID=UPI0025CF7185|nr:Calx-beta domain-containing protein [Nevskia sp.]